MQIKALIYAVLFVFDELVFKLIDYIYPLHISIRYATLIKDSFFGKKSYIQNNKKDSQISI